MNAPLWVEHLQSFGGFAVAPTQKWWLEDWRSSTHKCAFIINDFLRNPQFSCFLINWLKVISYLEYLMLSPKMAFWAVNVKRLMYLSFRAVSIDIFCAMVVFFGIVLKYFLMICTSSSTAGFIPGKNEIIFILNRWKIKHVQISM